jgi:hypothetical protein
MGIEPPANTPQIIAYPANGGAKSGALHVETQSPDADLALISACWSELPQSVRAGIVAMVRVAAPMSADEGR